MKQFYRRCNISVLSLSFSFFGRLANKAGRSTAGQPHPNVYSYLGK